MPPVFLYLKTVNFTIVPPIYTFFSHFHQELLFASEILFRFSLLKVRYSIPGHQRQSWLYGVWALSSVSTSTSLLVFQARWVNLKSQTQDWLKENNNIKERKYYLNGCHLLAQKKFKQEVCKRGYRSRSTILSPCSVSSSAGQIGETCKSQTKYFKD